MAEDTADQLKPEVEPTSRVERIGTGIVKFVENQLPPAHAKRYMRFYDAVQSNLGGKALEISNKLQPTIAKVAQLAGWGTTVAEVALTAAALYGGVQLVLHPELIGAGLGVVKAAGVAALAAGERAFRYVAFKAQVLGTRVENVWDKLIHPDQGIPRGPNRPDMPGVPMPIIPVEPAPGGLPGGK